MQMQVQELQHEVAALHALVRGLVAMSMTEDTLARRHNGDVQKSFNLVRPTDLVCSEGHRSDVGMAQLRAAELMREARECAGL